MVENAYPITLPTLKPPKTNATARERSSNGVDLHNGSEPYQSKRLKTKIL